MNYKRINEYRISEIGLGTAQLGMDYGISNNTGRPSEVNAFRILERGMELGINFADTAYEYGNSEAVLGDFRKNISPNLIVSTKLKKLSKYPQTKIKAEIINSVKTSKEQLGFERLPFVLLHEPELMYEVKVLEGLQDLKNHGLAKLVGVSVYEPSELEYAANLDFIDVIQAPLSVLDQRIANKESLDLIANKDKGLFVRSIFLQGVVLMGEENLPKELENLSPYIRELNRIAENYNRSVLELAVNFPLFFDGVTSVIVGVDSEQQLVEICEAYNSPPISKDLVNEIQNLTEDIPNALLDPRTWEC